MFNTVSGRGDNAAVVITPSSDQPTVSATYDATYESEGGELTLNKGTVSDPSHYNKGVSPYDVAKTMYGAEGLLKFVTVNAVKYVSRYPHKFRGNPNKQLDDLVKAKRSLETAIELHKEIYGDQNTLRHG
jgi:hypothetical protein|tara:strand:- start:2739 stop:3128 length:390 start_codon:yes stop_codon:yes gene_type:complete